MNNESITGNTSKQKQRTTESESRSVKTRLVFFSFSLIHSLPALVSPRRSPTVLFFCYVAATDRTAQRRSNRISFAVEKVTRENSTENYVGNVASSFAVIGVIGEERRPSGFSVRKSTCFVKDCAG